MGNGWAQQEDRYSTILISCKNNTAADEWTFGGDLQRKLIKNIQFGWEILQFVLERNRIFSALPDRLPHLQIIVNIFLYHRYS